MCSLVKGPPLYYLSADTDEGVRGCLSLRLWQAEGQMHVFPDLTVAQVDLPDIFPTNFLSSHY